MAPPADAPHDDRSGDQPGDASSADDRPDDAKTSPTPSRPVPVRAAMEAERGEPEPIEPPSATVEVDGDRWIVRVEGRTSAGHPSDVGASLLLLTFAKTSEPEERLREATVVGRRLDDFAPGELADLLRDAGPFRESWEPEDIFPGTRRRRSP